VICAAATVGLLLCGLLGLVLMLGGAFSSSSSTSSCGTALSAGEPPLTSYYSAAAKRFDLGADGYAYLASINQTETSFGTNLAVSSAGAIGWMQFEPATFAEYAVDVSDPGGKADPDNPQDAIYTAANMLHADGAPRDWGKAIYAYNHAQWYVNEIEVGAAKFLGPNGMSNLTAAINAVWNTASSSSSTTQFVSDTSSAGSCTSSTGTLDINPVPGDSAVVMPDGLARPGADAPTAVKAMVDAGDRIDSEAYSYGGGHCVAAMNQTTPNPDACPGDQENGGPGYDCSSATSYVLWGGGQQQLLGGQPEASPALETEGKAGAGKWVTWWASIGHAFIEVDGIVLDTVPGPTMVAPNDAPPTGPRWQAASQAQWEVQNDLSVGAFTDRHPAGL
jgi:Transglycosylase SLT domain